MLRFQERSNFTASARLSMRWSILQSVFVLCALPGLARGDGGTVRFSEEVGEYRVTVFTEPTPLRAGPVDLSVYVCDAQTDAHLPAATVAVRLTADGQSTGPWHAATRAAATNKLFHMATVDLTTPGIWRAEVRIDGPAGRASGAFPLEVGPPMPRWVSLAPWILWPIVPIGLYAWNMWRKQRRHA
jgi:hypothetical protein